MKGKCLHIIKMNSLFFPFEENTARTWIDGGDGGFDKYYSVAQSSLYYIYFISLAEASQWTKDKLSNFFFMK